MLIGSFGNSNEDGRPQLLLGITKQDVLRLWRDGALRLNEDEDPDNPLPAHLILMIGESDEEIENRIDRMIDTIKKERGDAEDDV